MNEKGWGLKDFLLILGIIFFALLITVVIYKVSFKKDDPVDPIDPKSDIETKIVSYYESYQDMEDAIKNAAMRYQNDHYQGKLESDETWILSYNLLLKDDYLKRKLYDLSDVNDECNGYVVFEKKGSNISYYPYIKCKNYKTAGYDSTKEE